MGDVTIQETIEWLKEKHSEYHDQAIKAEEELQRVSKEYLACVKRYYAYSTVLELAISQEPFMEVTNA